MFHPGREWESPYELDELGPFHASAELNELHSSPDRLAWRLLRKLYLEFGYDEQHIPYFDRDRGRFVFE